VDGIEHFKCKDLMPQHFKGLMSLHFKGLTSLIVSRPLYALCWSVVAPAWCSWGGKWAHVVIGEARVQTTD